jgi:hypothetical protein
MSLKQIKLSFWHYIAIIIVAAVIIITRRPDIINHPQLWAEDGKAFLEPVWNQGFLTSLMTPRDGYFQSLPKITMAIASSFGLSYVAIISTSIAIALRIFFVAFIMSSRFNYINLWFRIAFSIYFLLQPNIQEAYVNITNAHTYLAIYLLAVILAKDPNNTAWKMHDLFILILSGISGPFIALLAPSLAVKRYYERGSILNAFKNINTFDIVFACCMLIQVSSVMFGDNTRTPSSLGATIPLFFDIISYKVILGAFFDLNNVQWIIGKSIVNMFTSLIFISLSLYFLIKMDWRYKAAFCYVFFTLLVSLYKPVINHSEEQWPLFLIPIVGCRYFILSGMGIFCLSMIILSKITMRPYICVAILCIALFSSLSISYRMPPLDNVGYDEDVATYHHANDGKKVLIRTNPIGWSMELIKK